MSTPRSAIPVLRFHAGPLQLAIAAEDVKSVLSARQDVPHIATILGVEPSQIAADRRIIRVAVRSRHTRALDASPARSATIAAMSGADAALSPGLDPADDISDLVFQADAPLGVVRCNAADVLPMSRGMTADHWKPIMGFASVDGQTLLLLDIASVADKLLEYQERGPA